MSELSSKSLMCLQCGNEWNYYGSSNRPTCPKCKRKLLLEPKNKHSISMDLEKHGRGIINAFNSGKKRAILDCLGNDVVDVSIID